MEAEDTKSLAPIVWVPALTASMCCVPSVRYALYAVSLGMVAAGLAIYFRNRGICTLDQAKRERRRILNTSLAVFTASTALYLVWNYVILELIGIALGLPWEHTAFWSN